MLNAPQIKVDGLDELDLIELKEDLAKAGVNIDNQVTVSRTPVPEGAFGVPAEMQALIQIGQVAIPALIGVLALWASKGRNTASGHKTAFSWTKDGVTFEKLDLNSGSTTDVSAQIGSALKANPAPKTNE